MERIILHSDMNSFYASVECMLHPELKGKPVAVCGSTENRHGIVLAKSELAKKTGIKTGMVNWEAKQRCPNLITVPPHYDQYLKYSKLAREIYQRFSDCVEPYGPDECWVSLTNSAKLLGYDVMDMNAGEEIANKISIIMKEELGLTVSIGVSFNKIFAKLGSDMKKPDGVTIIRKDEYKDKVWSLPASELLYVGRQTEKKLNLYGIRTIGDLANTDPNYLKQWMGKHGLQIWMYANGFDESPVAPEDYYCPVKSVGHGITCVSDLDNSEEVGKVILELSQDIGAKLRTHGLSANGVSIHIRNNDLYSKQYQMKLPAYTQNSAEIAEYAKLLFEREYAWVTPVRAITVTAIGLSPKGQPCQMDIFDNYLKREKQDKIEQAVDDIRRRFGKKAIFPASLLGDIKMPRPGMNGYGADAVHPPGMMYQ